MYCMCCMYEGNPKNEDESNKNKNEENLKATKQAEAEMGQDQVEAIVWCKSNSLIIYDLFKKSNKYAFYDKF